MSNDAFSSGVKPYIPASVNMPELTLRALIMGVVLCKRPYIDLYYSLISAAILFS